MVCIYIYIHTHIYVYCVQSFPGGAVIKNPPANAGDARDADSIPGSERSSWSRKWHNGTLIIKKIVAICNNTEGLRGHFVK